MRGLGHPRCSNQGKSAAGGITHDSDAGEASGEQSAIGGFGVIDCRRKGSFRRESIVCDECRRLAMRRDLPCKMSIGLRRSNHIGTP